MRLAVILICLSLAACAGTDRTRAITTFAIACDSFSSTLATLAGLRSRNKLTAAEIRRVDEVRVLVVPVCLTKDPANPQALLNQIKDGVQDLIAIKKARQ